MRNTRIFSSQQGTSLKNRLRLFRKSFKSSENRQNHSAPKSDLSFTLQMGWGNFSTMSTFQAIKLQIVKILSLSKDAIHVYLGFGAFALTFLLFPRLRKSYLVLLPGFLLSVLLELLDLRDDLLYLGYFRWTASLHDIINTNMIPIVLFALLALTTRKAATTNP